MSIHRTSDFCLQEANQLVPILKKITDQYRDQVESLLARLESVDIKNHEVIDTLESQVNTLIQKWHSKIKKLGAIPNGLWVVSFNNGEGYYSWRYPEPEILYWYGYNEAYAFRKPLSGVESVQSVARKIDSFKILRQDESLPHS